MNIVVTGASRGIGKEICLNMAKEKSNAIIAVARSQQNPFIGIDNISYLNFDLNNTHSLPNLVHNIKEKSDDIDILINNAGALINKPMEDITPDEFDIMVNTNLKSTFFLTQKLLPLINSGAHIVNISSMGGYQGSAKFPGLSVYSAAKGAVAVLSECLAEELKERNISVNALALGAVHTEMLMKAFPGYEAPLKPSQMAEYICEFALSGHKFMNGKVIPVSLSTP